jgi:MinD superfamily P-loop ATPase
VEHAGFVDGALDVGEVRATPLIQAVVGQRRDTGHTVVDAPPGTSCAAIAAVEGADLVLLVSEPTPFGLHDLELALQMCRALKLEVAAFINRCDLGDVPMGAYLAARGVPLVGQLPFDREIATACAEGVLALNRVPAFASVVSELADHVLAGSSRLAS